MTDKVIVCYVWYFLLIQLKSVHLKETVQSKLWSFPITSQLTSKQVSLCIIENNHNFGWTEDRATVSLHWIDLNSQQYYFQGSAKNNSIFSASQQIFSNSYFVRAFAEHYYFQTLATIATLGKYPSGHYCDRPSKKSFYQQRLLPKSFRHIFLQRGVP